MLAFKRIWENIIRFFKLNNIATKTEATVALIVGKYKTERFVKVCLEVMSEQGTTIEKQAVSIKYWKEENKFLHTKLDQEGILYQKYLDKFKENNTILTPYTTQIK